MLITIDPFYNIEQYNESLHALKNNNIEYKEYIHVKTPFDWYVDIPSAPLMTNYEELPNSQGKFIVNKVQATQANEEYLLQRRNNDTGKKALEKFVLNKPMTEAKNSDYACFISVKNKDQLLRLTRDFPGKIWFMGSYYSNKFKVALCTNKMIKNYIEPENILLEKQSDIYEFELALNFKVFKLQDRLRKFTNTPYFENGKYYPVKIKQFNVNI